MKIFTFGIPVAGVIGKIGVFGILLLPIACHAEPHVDAPVALALTPKPTRMALLPRLNRTGRSGTARGVTVSPGRRAC